ncbi:MAG: hypothetical protein GY925_16950, partial [Actinomycetia bacterium]|nr:hypothetical protein [Actinomycetes bacterium]
MIDDDALRRLHDVGGDDEAADLGALRSRFVDFIREAGGDDAGDSDVLAGGGGPPENQPGPRTSGAASGIPPFETGDEAGPEHNDEGRAVSDTQGNDSSDADRFGDRSDEAGSAPNPSKQHPDLGHVFVLGAASARDVPELPADAPAGSALFFDPHLGWLAVPPAPRPIVVANAEPGTPDAEADDSVEFHRRSEVRPAKGSLGEGGVESHDNAFGFYDHDDDLPTDQPAQWGFGEQLPNGVNETGADGYPQLGGVDPAEAGFAPPDWNTPGHGIDQGYRPFPTIIPRISATASGFGDVVEYEGNEYFWDGDTWNEVGSRPLIGELTRHGDVTIHNGEPWVYLNGTWFKDHTDTPQPSPSHYWDTADKQWVEHDGVDGPPHQPGTVADQNGPNRFVWSDGGESVRPSWAASPDRPAPLIIDESTPVVQGSTPGGSDFDTFVGSVPNPTTKPAIDSEAEERRRAEQRRFDDEWERQLPRREIILAVDMDIGSAGSDEALQDLRAYVTVVDETEFEKGLDHFYAHHDFPESL